MKTETLFFQKFTTVTLPTACRAFLCRWRVKAFIFWLNGNALPINGAFFFPESEFFLFVLNLFRWLWRNAHQIKWLKPNTRDKFSIKIELPKWEWWLKHFSESRRICISYRSKFQRISNERLLYRRVYLKCAFICLLVLLCGSYLTLERSKNEKFTRSEVCARKLENIRSKFETHYSCVRFFGFKFLSNIIIIVIFVNSKIFEFLISPSVYKNLFRWKNGASQS